MSILNELNSILTRCKMNLTDSLSFSTFPFLYVPRSSEEKVFFQGGDGKIRRPQNNKFSWKAHGFFSKFQGLFFDVLAWNVVSQAMRPTTLELSLRPWAATYFFVYLYFLFDFYFLSCTSTIH